MHIDWWTLALQAINLLVLVWLLGRFLFRPIARIVEERQAAIAKTLDDARSMREQAEQAKRTADEAAAKVAAERNGLLEQAGEEAKAEKERLVAEGRAQADRIIEESKHDIDRMRESETAKSAKQASELAVDIAARLFDRLPSESRIAGFIAGLEAALAALPENARDEIGKDGAPLAVHAARELTGEEIQACREAIASAVGHDVDVAVTVEPNLIAGIEVVTPHATVSNSFRADLDRIADELTREGTTND